MVADGGEHVEDFAVVLRCIEDAVGGYDRQMKRRGEVEQGLVSALFVALMVALEFEIEIAAAVDISEAPGEFAGARTAFARERGGEGVFAAAGETDEAC